MPDVNDMALVREYAGRNSEPAFVELVHRHINLVYSVALRFTGNTADAQDVTQAVFIILARKAASLRQSTIVTGWLYETTRFTAMKCLRTKLRQQAREQEACMQSALDDSNPDGIWKQLAPLLEEAMARLDEKERALLALRFFENKSGAETAAMLGIQEWAARKRVERAVEKLRMFFTKRGVVLPAAVLTAAISANSVQAAPAALAKTVTVMALAKGAAASGSTLTLIKGAVKIMVWTKAKTAMVVGVGVLLAVGTTAVLVEKHIDAKQYIIAHEPWSDAGAATPKAALQSLAWALTHDKIDRAQELVLWNEKGAEYAKPPVEPAFEHQMALESSLAPALKDLESFKILSIEPAQPPDELIVKIEKTFKNRSIVPFAVTAKLRRVGGQWHVVCDLEYFEGGNVSMRLPFTGSF
jgi:RNA polymerase sigma factor (sigma-70 family)